MSMTGFANYPFKYKLSEMKVLTPEILEKTRKRYSYIQKWAIFRVKTKKELRAQYGDDYKYNCHCSGWVEAFEAGERALFYRSIENYPNEIFEYNPTDKTLHIASIGYNWGGDLFVLVVADASNFVPDAIPRTKAKRIILPEIKGGEVRFFSKHEFMQNWQKDELLALSVESKKRIVCFDKSIDHVPWSEFLSYVEDKNTVVILAGTRWHPFITAPFEEKNKQLSSSYGYEVIPFATDGSASFDYQNEFTSIREEKDHSGTETVICGKFIYYTSQYIFDSAKGRHAERFRKEYFRNKTMRYLRERLGLKANAVVDNSSIEKAYDALFQNNIKSYEKELNDAKKMSKAAEDELRDRMNRLSLAEEKIRNLPQRKTTMQEICEQICDIEGISKTYFEVADGISYLNVVTHPILVECKSGLVPVGAYRIRMSLDGIYDVKFTSLCNNTRSLPHVNGSGTAICWGGFAVAVEKVYLMFDILNVVKILMTWIVTYDPSSKYSYYLSQTLETLGVKIDEVDFLKQPPAPEEEVEELVFDN